MIFRRLFSIALLLFAALVFLPGGGAVRAAVQDANDYEGRRIESVEVVLEGAPRNDVIESELLSLLRVRANTEYGAVAVREALQMLFDSGRVANARVEVSEASGAASNAPLRVRFVVRPQARVAEVFLELGVTTGTGVSEDELRARLNMLEPGARASEQIYRTNADLIQVYLRDRGFYRADVNYEQQLDPGGTRATVTFRVNLGEQARVEAFNINVASFDVSSLRPALRLQPNAFFSQTLLGEDLNRIRQAIIRAGFLAPQLDDPQIIYDPTTNRITVNLRGSTGPKVNVALQGYELSDAKARELLPVRREGSIDFSAIVEGERRLRNRLQEDGYFFAEVTARCTVNPPLETNGAAIVVPGEGDRSCDSLNPEELNSRTVTVTYDVAPSSRLKLTDIRLEGTDKLSIEEIRDDLRTQEATALGFIPLLGYGRGYTSRELLERDQRTIEARMREVGYRKARATTRQSVSIDGENLAITFVVTEGPLTRVADVEIRGNQIYTAERLRDERCRADEPCTVIGGAFSRAQARSDGERLLGFYARNGYAGADVDFDIVELPAAGNGDERVRIIYTIKEGGKVFVNRIFVNGNIRTRRESVLEALPLKEGVVLRGDQLTESERILYNTGAFRQVIIRTDAAGETASGFAKRDIIIDVEELKPRDLVYGGGFSTDAGPLGIFEFRNNNLFGKLQQAAIRTRASRRQQLVQLEFIDPRFRRYGERGFAPLTVAAQYQRDTNVTRFFRSTLDRGNLGIVQRLDEGGNPVDLGCLAPPCEPVGEPTINRFTFNVETRRDFELDLGPRGQVMRRSTLFLRYTYEDVRLYNINSLLLRDILQPDRTVRLSRLGASFARDTRDDPTNTTRGEFFTLDYALALRQLGGNLSFNRFLGTYRRFFKFDAVRRGTILAGSTTLGLANIFNPRDRNENGVIDEIDRTLPISERFFSGGAASLRGFAFEEAGPRRVIVPQGTFFNRNGEQVTLQPFTVPVGGNALAIVNLEARVPLTQRFQVVPFYDGGNVFRGVRDIFRTNSDETIDPNLRARWTHTVGVGLRLRTPFGALGVDYGFLLNPPMFTAFDPATGQPIALPQVRRSQIHIRFGQAF